MVRLLGRALRKPPHVVARRAAQELDAHADRYLAPWRARRFDASSLLRACGERDVESLWQRLAAHPYPANTTRADPREYGRLCPGDADRIRRAAEDAARHRVRLLGPKLVDVGDRIDWLCDFHSGVAWPRGYMRDIACVNPDDASNVKMPWDQSRLHWLMPAGQAYLLDGDERWAEATRGVTAEKRREPGRARLRVAGRSFQLEWSPAESWTLSIGVARVSPSHGVASPIVRLLFSREGEAEPLVVKIAPEHGR
jgi:hypothetical protein